MPSSPVYLPAHTRADLSSPAHTAHTATPTAAAAQPRSCHDLHSAHNGSGSGAPTSPFVSTDSFLTAVASPAYTQPPPPLPQPTTTTTAPVSALARSQSHRFADSGNVPRGYAFPAEIEEEVEAPVHFMPRCLPYNAAAGVGEEECTPRGCHCATSGINLSTLTTTTTNTTATTTSATPLPFTPGVSTSTAPAAADGRSISMNYARRFSPHSCGLVMPSTQLPWVGGSFDSRSACVSQMRGGSGVGGGSTTSAMGLRLVGEDVEWLQPSRGDSLDAAPHLRVAGMGEALSWRQQQEQQQRPALSLTSPSSAADDFVAAASAVTQPAAQSSASAPWSTSRTAAASGPTRAAAPSPFSATKGSLESAYARLERAVQPKRAAEYDGSQRTAALTDDEDDYAAAMLWAAEQLAVAK